MAVQKFLQNGAGGGLDGTFQPVQAADLAGLITVDVAFVIPGGGSVLTTGNKGWLRIPAAMTITNWHILADVSGSITIDILRTNNGFPVTSMVGAGIKPNLTAQQINSAAPSGWTSTAFAVDDWAAFNITAATTVTQITISLTCIR